MEEKSVSLPKVIHVTVNDRQIEVKKLGLIKYAQLTESLQDLIGAIFEIVQLPSETPVDATPEERTNIFKRIMSSVLKKNIEQVITFLDICVPDLGYEYICNEVGAEDCLNLFEAILKVNGINKVIGDVKNFLRSLQGTQI